MIELVNLPCQSLSTSTLTFSIRSLLLKALVIESHNGLFLKLFYSISRKTSKQEVAISSGLSTQTTIIIIDLDTLFGGRSNTTATSSAIIVDVNNFL